MSINDFPYVPDAASQIYFLDLQIQICKIYMSNFQFQEFPFVRYKASKDADSTNGGRDLIPMKLAEAVWNIITTYKSSIPNFPSTETCELLIVDRSVDQVSESRSHYFIYPRHKLIFSF